MNQLTKILNQFTTLEFERLLKTYPDEAANLETLKKLIHAGVAENAENLDDLGNFVDSIQDEGGALDVGGYVYSELFDFQDELRKRIRETLSESTSVFPELSVKLERAASSSALGGSCSKKPGERTKLGGVPDWIQSEETPICSSCRMAMSFVGQIDSIGTVDSEFGRSLAESEAFVFFDCGMIYVFWCKRCGGTKSVCQFS